jgi:nucleotide-binding universal stress UspA family protein
VNPLRSILVHLDCGPHCASRLLVARALAQRLGAAVSAMYAARPAYVDLSLLFTAGLPDPQRVALDDARLAAARQLVVEACREPGAPIEWLEAGEQREREFTHRALCADLLILGQHPRTPDTGVSPDFVQRTVIETGKPALVVPCTDLPPHGPSFGTVLVAWNASREAARALSAAIPMLRKAEAVHIALDSDIVDAHRALLQRFLHRHGLDAQFHPLPSPAHQVGDALLAMAGQSGADLMVMGCYGHSRGRELVLGGATRTVLHAMTIPVLMAH